jgi:hypothetical protein
MVNLLTDQETKLRNQRADGSGAVADQRLDHFAKLAKRAVIFDNLKIWIIAESAAAGGLEANPAIATAAAFGLYRAARVGQRRVTLVMGGALFQRQLAELFDQEAIV